MPKLFLLLVIVIFLTACGGGGGGNVPTLVPTVGGDGSAGGQQEGDSPRQEGDSGLPPTWTPPPTSLPATAAPAVADGTPLPSGNGQTYTVQAGDTLAEIAQSFGVTVSALADANDIANIDVIEVGQVLVIP